VQLDVGNYEGGYLIDTAVVYAYGSAALDLAPGVHTFDVAREPGSAFSFVLGADGSVSGISNPATTV